MMLKMMDRALEAQKAQKPIEPEQEQPESPRAEQPSNGTAKATRNGKSPSPNGTRKEKPRVQNAGEAANGQSDEPQVKIVPASTAKYASDLRYKKPAPGNGAHHEEVSSTIPTALPRKKRGKR
jgi:hypothetical protein